MYFSGQLFFLNRGTKTIAMDRREFLAARRKRKQAEPAPPAQYRTNSGINPYSGSWTDQDLIHLLKRTMFGAKKADVDYFRGMTMSQVVDELLNPTAPNPNPPVKEYVTSTTPRTPKHCRKMQAARTTPYRRHRLLNRPPNPR